MNYSHAELIARLKEYVSYEKKGGLPIINKNIPFQEDAGGLDPRVRHFLSTEVNPVERRPLDIGDLDAIRDRVEVHNYDISSGIRSQKRTITVKEDALTLHIYNQTEEAKPVLMYIHGGGFFERDMDVMENVCKYLAQEAEAVVIAVEYRLAPEYPYRHGLDDCLDAVQHIYEHADALKIDPNAMGLVGDSVGANLALGVHHLSLAQPWDIKYIGLLCPLVDLSDVARDSWSIDKYNLTKDDALIRQELTTMQESLIFIQTLYLTNLEDVLLPLVSPLLRKDKTKLPPISIATSEFDFLRIQAEDFSEQAAAAGVSVQHFNYKGMDHAFVRKLGYYPQAADAIQEISAHFQDVLQQGRTPS
ncbi:alpha/beta hydrolase [Alkalicoccus chagannorensis]|uniref:alpha/beta hydrolase n=1 Tax=Alkalicoccus chagannorensis TaxID=427072 RepID=UPI0004037A60|nr:alpha/beta hydrolase [Alkalicoccus chagannorensis]